MGHINDRLDINHLLNFLDRSYKSLKKRLGTKSDDITDVSSCLGMKFDRELMDTFNIFLLLLNLK